MTVRHTIKNAIPFETLNRGAVFGWNGSYFMVTTTIYSDFDKDYDTYNETYNAVNLQSGHMFYFAPEDKVVLYPDAILEI